MKPAPGQIIDGEWGADIQLLAYSREQAGYLFNASRAMLSNEESLLHYMREADILRSTKREFCTKQLIVSCQLRHLNMKVWMERMPTTIFLTRFTLTMTILSRLSMTVQARKRKNWITWYISTNGTKRDKLFDKYYSQWIDILSGKIENDSVMPWIYKLDDISEIHNPDSWPKAMPLLGITTEKRGYID